jgi:hypothetical protein
MGLWWLFLIAGLLAGVWLVRRNIRERFSILWVCLYVVGLLLWVWMHVFARSHQGSEHYWWVFILGGFVLGVVLFSWRIRRGIIYLLLAWLLKIEEAFLNRGDDDADEIKRRGNNLIGRQ